MICMRCRKANVEQVSTWNYRCPVCGHLQFDDGSPSLLGNYEDVYGTGKKPAGCEACDSDTYPMCRQGCNLIDQ